MGPEARAPALPDIVAAPATDPEGSAVPGAGRTDRRGALKAAARHGAIAPAASLLYALGSWNEPNRPAMLAVSVLLLATAAGVSRSTDYLARWPKFRAFNLAGILIHVTGYAVLAYLDRGVAGPLGDVLFFLMAFTAITVPFRQFVVVGVASVGAYAVVAIVGPPAPPGYAAVCSLSFIVVCVLMARHSRALASMGRRLSEMSRIDPLTGCLNRRGFDERLADEVSRSDRSGRPFTLVTVDLDAFKAVNDTYGHHVGDDLLAWTGRTLQRSLHAPQAVGRLGGDEFADIVADIDVENADSVIDPCRMALDDATPVSIGRATYPVEAPDLSELLRLADQRLYEDKALHVGRARSLDGPATAAIGRVATDAPSVSAVERRQWSISDMGWIAAVNFGLGCVYASTESSNMSATVFALLLLGFTIGVGIVAMAATLARTKSVGIIMGILGPVQFVVAVTAAILDGGVDSIIALGMLNPLLVISLTTPRQVVLPLGAAVLASYIGMGVLVGAPSGWYVATHVIGIGIVSLASIRLGRAAAHRRRQLTRLSRVDSLTGCLNRRGFEERFDVELRRTSNVSLLLFDLDDFKAVNDAQGHAAGDELLCWVGAAINDAVRTHDLVGRFGGDEFIAMLCDCPADESRMIADRIRATLSPRIAVSIGAASLGHDGVDLDSLYRYADAALYAEKRSHRESRRTRSLGPDDVHR